MLSARAEVNRHLVGARFGGSNKVPRNFVTMHRFTNLSVMRKTEDQIREAIDARGKADAFSIGEMS